MAPQFTRQGLYDLIWSKPMKRLASELGIDVGPLTSLLRRAKIPAPPPGYWMKKEFGKQVFQPPLPAAPEGLSDPLTLISKGRQKISRPRSAKSEVAQVQTIAPEVAREAAPLPSSTVAPTHIAHPTQPTKLTRDELYAAVWKTPMVRLAQQYGITGNGLAKICDRADVPYPPRGYWAKHAAGKAVTSTPLPKTKIANYEIVIRPTPLPAPAVELPALREDVRRDFEAAREKAATVTVQVRLVRPHPIIAQWLAEHEERKQRARRERDPSMKRLYDPGDFSDTDRRLHRVLDTFFKAIEIQGAKVAQEDGR